MPPERVRIDCEVGAGTHARRGRGTAVPTSLPIATDPRWRIRFLILTYVSAPVTMAYRPSRGSRSHLPDQPPPAYTVVLIGSDGPNRLLPTVPM